MNVEQYFQNGFYFGNVDEFIDDIEEFNQKCQYITSLSLNDDYYWRCQYLAKHDETNENELLPAVIPLRDKIKRQQFIEKNKIPYISRTNIIVPHEDVKEILNYFLNKATSFIETIYGSKYVSYHHGIHCYTEGDKLDPHTDNHNVADCAMVIYFSPDQWNDNGGLLKLTELGDECLPIQNNFSLLDLTNHRIRHEVTTVTGNFRRYSYLLFATKVTN